MEQGELLERLRARLAERAPAGEIVSYRELVVLAEVPAPQSVHRLTLALEDLAREDAAAGRPLLAALAVGRANGNLPGRGFFHLLRELGRYDGPDGGPEAAAWHARELAALRAGHGGGGESGR